MLQRKLALVISGLTLGASLAFAEPEFILRYPGGVPQVSITGDYAGSSYTVWRQRAAGGEPVRITDQAVLCMGSCQAVDRTAVPGGTYFYLFEVASPGGVAGALARYGPYPATISPALARAAGVYVYPNPGRGPTGIQLYVAGATGDRPRDAEAVLYDLAGRRLRTLHRGPLARGLTTVTWDGRDDRGELLPAGVFLLRFTADGDVAVSRIVRL
jgi:hypothetical protein